ncbi:hypothetical protein LWI29_019241 [Acer saccharum]|uniref:Uncharacterized protein n=1 Tax=Acer saccharum TaxID=4024 RepID=A0AA39SF51_ACESA|nr:hypothetical protein LWI29_019241 [Acer saccharum]
MDIHLKYQAMALDLLGYEDTEALRRVAKYTCLHMVGRRRRRCLWWDTTGVRGLCGCCVYISTVAVAVADLVSAWVVLRKSLARFQTTAAVSSNHHVPPPIKDFVAWSLSPFALLPLTALDLVGLVIDEDGGLGDSLDDDNDNTVKPKKRKANGKRQKTNEGRLQFGTAKELA